MMVVMRGLSGQHGADDAAGFRTGRDVIAVIARRRIRASHAPATPTARQAGIVRAFKVAWEAKDIGALIARACPAPRPA